MNRPQQLIHDYEKSDLYIWAREYAAGWGYNVEQFNLTNLKSYLIDRIGLIGAASRFSGSGSVRRRVTHFRQQHRGVLRRRHDLRRRPRLDGGLVRHFHFVPVLFPGGACWPRGRGVRRSGLAHGARRVRSSCPCSSRASRPSTLLTTRNSFAPLSVPSIASLSARSCLVRLLDLLSLSLFPSLPLALSLSLAIVLTLFRSYARIDHICVLLVRGVPAEGDLLGYGDVLSWSSPHAC